MSGGSCCRDVVLRQLRACSWRGSMRLGAAARVSVGAGMNLGRRSWAEDRGKGQPCPASAGSCWRRERRSGGVPPREVPSQGRSIRLPLPGGRSAPPFNPPGWGTEYPLPPLTDTVVTNPMGIPYREAVGEGSPCRVPGCRAGCAGGGRRGSAERRSGTGAGRGRAPDRDGESGAPSHASEGARPADLVSPLGWP